MKSSLEVDSPEGWGRGDNATTCIKASKTFIPINPVLRFGKLSLKKYNYKDSCTNMFIPALFVK